MSAFRILKSIETASKAKEGSRRARLIITMISGVIHHGHQVALSEYFVELEHEKFVSLDKVESIQIASWDE